VAFEPIDPGALVPAYFGLEQQLASITGKAVDLVLPDCRMRRGIRYPQWWMLLAILAIDRFAEG
jgi:hypothetical protein